MLGPVFTSKSNLRISKNSNKPASPITKAQLRNKGTDASIFCKAKMIHRGSFSMKPTTPMKKPQITKRPSTISNGEQRSPTGWRNHAKGLLMTPLHLESVLIHGHPLHNSTNPTHSLWCRIDQAPHTLAASQSGNRSAVSSTTPFIQT